MSLFSPHGEFFKDFDENDEKQMTAFNELMSRYYEISKEIDDWIEEGLSEADKGVYISFTN